MNNKKTVTLRCACGAEAVVFSKYTFKNEVDYDISIEDSYIGYCGTKSFFGRLKRAWKAFIDKPLCYASVYCESKEDMKTFLTSCLSLMNTEEPEELKDEV